MHHRCLSPEPASSCCRHELNLFRLSGIQVEPFITTINIHHISQTSIVLGTVSGTGFYLFRTDNVSSGRISSLPDGYYLFRTGSVHTERMLDIRGVSGVSI